MKLNIMMNIRKRNRLFDRILKEAMGDTETTDENDDYQLQIATGFLDKPLETIFSDVLQACRKENELNYSNLTISKKSIPCNELNRIFNEVYEENENTLDDTSYSLNEKTRLRNKTKFYPMNKNHNQKK